MPWFIVAAVAFTASYVQAKKAQREAKKLAESMAGVLINQEGSSKAIPVVYGERRVGGTRVFLTTSGDEKHKYLYMALVVSEGEVDSITDIHIDDIPITDSRFSGLVQYEIFTGSDNQAASTILPTSFNDTTEILEWKGINLSVPKIGYASNFKLSGTAYIALRLEFDEDAFGGVPDITCTVRGRKVYDPRTGLTEWSSNPALCLRDYLTNVRYGKGLPSSSINDTLFIKAANDCDTFTVTPYSGATGQVKLLELNAVIDTEQKLFQNVEKILLACRGFMPYSNGQYGLLIDQSSLPVLTLDSDKIVGGIEITGESKENIFNQVVVTFPDPETDWQPNNAIWPDPSSSNLTSVPNGVGGFYTEAQLHDIWVQSDGEVLVDEVDLDFTTDYYAARDLARILCWRSRENMLVTLTATSEAIDLGIGDVVNVTHPTPNWTNKPFQVDAIALNYDGTVGLTLREYTSTIYAYDPAAEAIIYDDVAFADPFSIDSPTNLVVTAGTEIQDDGTIRPYLDLSWDAPQDATVSSYIVQWTTNGYINSISTKNPAYRLYVSNAAFTYDVAVFAVNAIGVKSLPVTQDAVQPVGDTEPPAAPVGATPNAVIGELNSIHLLWVNPTDPDFARIEINRSADSNFINSTLLATTGGTEYVDGEFNAVSTFYYWIRAVDYSGNASSWTYLGSGTSRLLVSDDFGNGVIAYDFLDTSLKSSVDLIATKADSIDLDAVINDVSFTQNTAIDLANTALQSALVVHQTNQTMIDAGVVVDPQTGTVSIYGVQALQDTVSQVQIDLNAAEANINLKAEYSYVDQAIANANFDPSQIADLTDLYARVGQAELDIDAAESNINLKADLTIINDPVTGLDARITQAEIDIDGAEAAILLKASQADLDTLSDRVTTAEIDISAIDAPAITQTVYDVRNLYNDVADLSNVSLDSILSSYKDRKATKQEIAFAQQRLTADVNDAREATAQSRLELLTKIEQNTASIISEQTARTTEDYALAQSILQLDAEFTDGLATANASITSEQIARAAADSAIAQDVLTLEGRVDTAEGNITQINSVNVSSTSALVQAHLSLEGRVGTSEAEIQQINFIDVTSTSAVASTLASVSSTVDGHTTTIGQHTTSIDGIEGRYSLGINNNGHISGFGLISEMNAGSTDPRSAFVIAADTFAITNEVSAPQWSATTAYGVGAKVYYYGKLYECILSASAGILPTNTTYWSDVTDYAFVVYTTDTQVNKNGQAYTIPAGVYMRDGFIQKAAIGSEQVQDSSIGNAKITGVIKSDANASDGNPKWSIDKSGGAVFRGIEIRGDDGTLLMASGSAMDYSVIGGTKPPSNADNTASSNQGASWLTDPVVYSGNKISSENIGTYISSLAVGTLYIGDNAVTLPDFGSLIFTLDSEKYIAKGVTKTTDDILFVEGRTDANAVVTATILIYPLHSSTGGLSTSYANFNIYVVALDYNAAGTLLGAREPMGIDYCALAARTSQNFTFSLLDIPLSGTSKTKYRIKVTCNSIGTGAYGVGIDYPTITFLEVKK